MTQFDDMGEHGTKIIVFNLWFNDDGDMELDFISDEKVSNVDLWHPWIKVWKSAIHVPFFSFLNTQESCISLYYKEKKEKSPIQSNLFTFRSR